MSPPAAAFTNFFIEDRDFPADAMIAFRTVVSHTALVAAMCITVAAAATVPVVFLRDLKFVLNHLISRLPECSASAVFLYGLGKVVVSLDFVRV